MPPHSPPGGGGSAEGWDVVWDCTDLASLPAHDFKVTPTADVNDVSMTLMAPTKCSQMELDGSTGLLMACDLSEFGFLYDQPSYWTGAMLHAAIEDLIDGWDGTQQFALQALWASVSGRSAYYDGAGMMIAEKTVPDAANQMWQAKNGRTGSDQAQISKGGNPSLLHASTPLFWEIIYPLGGKAPYARAGAFPGTWEAPGTWASVGEGLFTPGNYQTPQAGTKLLTGASTNLLGFNVNQQLTGNGPVSAVLTGFRFLVP